MKKAVLILHILCLLCSAVGCGSSSGGSSGSVLFPPEPKGDTPSETRWDESAEMPAAEEETSLSRSTATAVPSSCALPFPGTGPQETDTVS